jgi:FkbM family methyltransferase
MALTTKHRLSRTLGRQHWIPRGRDRVLRLFANPDTQPAQRFETPFYGLSNTGDLSNYIDWSVFFYGSFAPNEIELLHLLARELGAAGPVNLYDVGANVGHHSLAMAPVVGQVFAFEPFPPVRAEMARKLAHAGVDNVRIFPVALGDVRGEATFFAPSGANLGTGSVARRPDNSQGEEITVDIWRGDDFLAANDLPPISLLKIDVETHEAAVVMGLRERLVRDRPVILMEISGENRSGFASEAHLRELLYPGAVLREVGRRRDGFVLEPFMLATAAEVLVTPPEFQPRSPRLRETPV